jgi:hypothetical protein
MAANKTSVLYMGIDAVAAHTRPAQELWLCMDYNGLRIGKSPDRKWVISVSLTIDHTEAMEVDSASAG